MSARSLTLIVAGALALAPLASAQEDHAVPRGGGSSSGGGSHPSAGVHSSGGGSQSSHGQSSPSGSWSGSTAERRHPRAGTGHGGGYYPGHPVYPGYPGWGGYYPPYYPVWGWSYWWPYSGWYGGYWGYPWGFGGGAVYYHDVDQGEGSIRVLVNPSEARVYVDGYYTGTVDDFDGLLQRLRLSPGRHEIALKLEGYKTHRIRLYVVPDRTIKLSYDMEKGQGETFEDLAGDVPDREVRQQRAPEPPGGDTTLGAGSNPAQAGRIVLSVEPEDASVYVDGAFRGEGRSLPTLALPPGRHHIEVVRPGYRTQERDVEVAPGQPTEIVIRLERAGS
jgi:hypothetical protein